jgi:hypothetical protein
MELSSSEPAPLSKVKPVFFSYTAKTCRPCSVKKTKQTNPLYPIWLVGMFRIVHKPNPEGKCRADEKKLIDLHRFCDFLISP